MGRGEEAKKKKGGGAQICLPMLKGGGAQIVLGEL